jgi:predicted mannosyl-3-phosphoglycerate phosphatase (HAD superfamily)
VVGRGRVEDDAGVVEVVDLAVIVDDMTLGYK